MLLILWTLTTPRLALALFPTYLLVLDNYVHLHWVYGTLNMVS